VTPVGGATSYLANTTTTTAAISSYNCPSDIGLAPLNATASTSTGQYKGYLSRRSNYLLPCGRYYEAFNPTIMSGRPTDGGVFSGTDTSTTIANINDGTSNTLLAVESRNEKTSVNYGPYWGQGLWSSTHALIYDANPKNTKSYSVNWASTMPNGAATVAQVPAANNPRRLGFAWSIGSLHSGGVNVAFADGSVRFIKDSINPSTWFATCTIGNGEVVSSDAF
jgi:prepilin-type processing-associated H-X9-DG protein